MSENFTLWILMLLMLALFAFALYEAVYDRSDA